MSGKRNLYLEAESGISGDMFAASMLDLGADRKALQRALDSIPEEGFHTEIGTVNKTGIQCCDFRVHLAAKYENHDHDMEYLYGVEDGIGHSHGEEQAHEHGHGEGHMHEHSRGEGHSHEHGEGHGDKHVHRTLQDVREILWQIDMSEQALALADRIFYILAEAEAKAHGKTVDTIHFHEVGAIDSIVDIVTAAVCFESLNIDKVYIPYLFEGGGTVRCAHGLLPIPVPAVLHIAEEYQLSLQMHPEIHGEYITPTGAAIAAAIMTDMALPERIRIVKSGYGAGKREQSRPGFLRAVLFENDAPSAQEIWKLETDLDDCSGEVLGFVMERLFTAGIPEAHYTPIFMKKNRPAWTLTVLCPESLREAAEEIIFEETTTIGIRRVKMERRILEREIVSVDTPAGIVEIKVCSDQSGDLVHGYPEYESVKKAALRSGISFREVYTMAEYAFQSGRE